ncbi:Signal peptidase complex subunit 3 [Coelomomyces lativittatus]|nr:Signal peptidase complex subunit 3 [Coelomomyces lativittatus]KAJ1514314.1 Signal peptidase complex subunit 3 [Coelomomyces lativittatus]
MHSILNRFNIWTTLGTTAIFCLALLISLTSHFFLPNTPSALPTLHLSNVFVTKAKRELHSQYQSYYHSPSHYGQLHFNLTLDLRPVFHWNTKQIYAFLTLHYSTPHYDQNEIVFWDAIIADKEEAYQELDLTKNKYAIHDFFFKTKNQLIGNQGNITLGWSIVPNVGYIQEVQSKIHLPIQFLEPLEEKETK